MASRFWTRYRHSPVFTEFLDRIAYFTKAACAIYLVRENLIEFTVVSGPGSVAATAATDLPCPPSSNASRLHVRACFIGHSFPATLHKLQILRRPVCVTWVPRAAAAPCWEQSPGLLPTGLLLGAATQRSVRAQHPHHATTRACGSPLPCGPHPRSVRGPLHDAHL